jgi:hypothetical protein
VLIVTPRAVSFRAVRRSASRRTALSVTGFIAPVEDPNFHGITNPRIADASVVPSGTPGQHPRSRAGHRRTSRKPHRRPTSRGRCRTTGPAIANGSRPPLSRAREPGRRSQSTTSGRTDDLQQDARLGRHASAPSGRVPTTATAGESERKPAPGVERLLILLSTPERTSPHRAVHPGMRTLCEDDRPPTPAVTQSGLLDVDVPPEAMVVRNQQPAPRRARRDDLITLPSTWVVARIAGRTG